jgi:putative flavoprotein involved in K+ transport
VRTTVVIGAGHAGLAVSWHLAAQGIDHVVLEAGRIGESWRTGRWDSFAINTPNWSLQLPGDATVPEPADGFLSRDAWVAVLEAYVRRHDLPVRSGARVSRLGGSADGPGFVLVIDGDPVPLSTRSVVVAAGFQRVGRIPAIADGLPSTVLSIHASDYRRPDALPAGAALIVGSGQSGAQIAEDLHAAGREVLLSASAVPRCPRRYRGRDIIEWLVVSGAMDLTPDRLPDPRMRDAKQPMVSGVGRHGHSVSLQWLAAQGVRLLGRLVAVDGDRIRFAPDLADSIRFGDRASAEIRQSIDRTIEARGLSAPDAEPDAADEPAADPDGFRAPESLDLAAAGISCVIWATGFGADLSWVDLPIAGPDGMPANVGGRASVPGLWYTGIPWMRSRKSGVILGAADDAPAVVDELVTWLG